MQFLRVITGSADGKIRIWNLLNGDCLRVMRGTSQLDPVLSISIHENRILVNTEYNVLLMEFEIVSYEYGSQRELGCDNISKSDDQKGTQRPYSAIRANRMALVDTANSKIFNDGRKSALSHSFGPMSQKLFDEARQVYTPANNSRLSSAKRTTNIQHFKSASMTDQGNQAVRRLTSKTSSANDGAMTTVDSTPIDLKQIKTDQLHRCKTVSLDEAKTMLKHQLKHMRQGEYKELMDKQLYTTIAPMPKNSDRVNKYAESAADHVEAPSRTAQRPQSSPSKYDTRTMVNKNADNELRSLIAKPDTINAQTPAFTSKTLNHFGTVKQPVPPRPMSSFVSKIFETNEKDLRTNGMYPSHVNSKLPNPIVVTTSRPTSAIDTDSPSMASTSKTQLKSNTNGGLHSKSQASMVDRPKTPCERPKSAKKTVQTCVSEIYETNKLTAHDDLKLMTYSEIDDIVKQVDIVFDSTQRENFRIQQANYKKLWQLKSIGQYHGSLLARPKPFAPEIRE